MQFRGLASLNLIDLNPCLNPMTIAIARINELSDFQDELNLLIEGIFSDHNNEIELIKFIAVAPPLIPEEPFDINVARNKGYYNFPPTGPMYLCASIDSLQLPNVECEVVDLNNYLLKLSNTSESFCYHEWQKAFDSIPSNDNKRLYVFMVSYMFGTTKECYINTTRFIRSTYPNALILTGGVQATFDKSEILSSNYADIVCANEGDMQVQYIASELYKKYLKNTKNDLNDTCVKFKYCDVQGGINLLTNKGNIINSGDVVQPSDFNWDLSKYYDSIDIKSYHLHGGLGAFSKFVESLLGNPIPYSAVLTKRGCRAHCSFCTVRSFNGKGLRLRSIEAVVDEIRFLYNTGIRHIDWLDDDLLFDEEYNIQLFTLIKDEFPDLIWTASNGLIGVAITPDLMKLMSESGLVAFKIGVESGNSQVIKEIRKPTTLWRLLEKSKLIRSYPQIFFSANFIIGFPGESFMQMMDSFIYAKKLMCDWSSFYVCQPLKGTDLYSSFQHLMDPRAKDETYTKTINPGRSAARGEFAYSESEEALQTINAGWHIFDLPDLSTFDAKIHNEIWFTFNLVANFLDNPCYRHKSFTVKLIHWLRSIHSGYPFDASMTAALSHAYYLIGDYNLANQYSDTTQTLIINSNYWQQRVIAFPQLLTLCRLDSSSEVCEFLNIEPPKKLIPDAYRIKFDQLTSKREKNGWRD